MALIHRSSPNFTLSQFRGRTHNIFRIQSATMLRRLSIKSRQFRKNAFKKLPNRKRHTRHPTIRATLHNMRNNTPDRTYSLRHNLINFNTKVTRRRPSKSTNRLSRSLYRFSTRQIRHRITSITMITRLLNRDHLSHEINITGNISHSPHSRIRMLLTINVPSRNALATRSHSQQYTMIIQRRHLPTPNRRHDNIRSKSAAVIPAPRSIGASADAPYKVQPSAA